jgi:hypothetical protein
MTHSYSVIPGDLTYAEKLVSVMGEQSIYEVNGGNRAYTPWELFLANVLSSLLRWLFYVFFLGYFIWKLT